MCWVWTAYQTRLNYREREYQLWCIVKRSPEIESKMDTYYSLFWDGSYIASCDSYAEAAYYLARQLYGLGERFLVPSEILASFDVRYIGTLPVEIDGGRGWVDDWGHLANKLTSFGRGEFVSIGKFLTSGQDFDHITIPDPIPRPERRIIHLGDANSTLEASSALCGMDDKQAAEVVAYLNEPERDFGGLSRKEKRRLRRERQRNAPHFLQGLVQEPKTSGRRSRFSGNTVYNTYDVYDVPRYQKPFVNPTPLGKKVEGHRFVECPENWEDCSDMSFRDIMAWRCSRPDTSKDRVDDKECFFELDMGQTT
jgi:hypothetical protein